MCVRLGGSQELQVFPLQCSAPLRSLFLCSREHQIGMGLVCVLVCACEPPVDAVWKMCVLLIYNHWRKQNCKSHPQIFLIGDACNKQTHHEFPRTGRSPPSLGSRQLPAPLGLWGSHGLVPRGLSGCLQKASSLRKWWSIRNAGSPVV